MNDRSKGLNTVDNVSDATHAKSNVCVGCQSYMQVGLGQTCVPIE